jgi:hypothetical protein
LAQQVNLKPVNTFNKGLITEATVMTFPEGASSDELNCDLLKNGARQRRRGIQFEENFQESSFTVNSGDFVHKENWQNVSGIGGTEFLVVQVNEMVYFYDKSTNPVSASLKPFSINLNDYAVGNEFSVNETLISTASITGSLVIVSAAIDPIVVEYFPSSNSISVEKIDIRIRDFEYLGMSSNITFVSRSSNVVTITTNTSHELAVNDQVQINCSLGEFNGLYIVTSTPTSTTFRYSLTGPNLSQTAATGFVYESYWDSNTEKFPTRITRNYQYDLYNMGWAEQGVFGNRNNPYTFWRSNNNGFNRSDYPPRNKPWWVGRIASANYFDFPSFINVKQGSTLAPNGRYILNFFNQNRSGATTGAPPGAISGLTTIVETARFNSTEAYAGRVWYAGLNSAKNGGKIFFTKVIEDKQDFGYCYQKADPTSQDTAGLVDSDGGYIVIPDANNIVALFSTGSVLYVLANNGVWIIGGVDQVFKATEYYVNKLSNFGILNKNTLVNVSGTPIYWSTNGIYAITTELDKPSVQNISEPIKTFYDSISTENKIEASSVFDRLNNKIYWLYPSESETVLNKKNKILILDMNLQAYFPWEVKDTTGTSPYILDAYFLSGLGSSPVDFNVLVGDDQVIDDSSNTVIQTITSSGSTQTEIKFIVRTAGGKITFAEFSNRNFLDWGSADYSSYAETGYDFMGSATLKKNTPYITTYLKRTEQNFVASGGGYEADYPSACLLTTKWDLSGDSSRWSNPSQVYRLMNYPTANPNNLTFSYPYDTIVARTKIRGKGRVMRMRFESESGKDFYLIGWEIVSGSNPRY